MFRQRLRIRLRLRLRLRAIHGVKIGDIGIRGKE